MQITELLISFWLAAVGTSLGQQQFISGLALGDAVRRGNFNIVDEILSRRPHLASSFIAGFDDDENEQNQRTTPLHIAIKAGNVEMVRLLIERGAHVNVANGAGTSALGWALRRNATLPMLALLLEHGGAEPLLLEYRDLAGRTPLQMAVTNGNIGAVRMLLSAGANANAGDDGNCSAPLSMTVQLRASSMLLCANLTGNEDAFTSCQNHHQTTYLAIGEMLVHHGANPRLVDPCSLQAPLDLARRIDDAAMLELFGNSAAVPKVHLNVVHRVKSGNSAPTPSKNDTVVQMPKVNFRQFALFELVAFSRCSGSSRGGSPAPAHSGNVRMISADECAAVCAEITQCYGFNLMLTETSDSRGNGCIIKAGPCHLEPDPMFAFYRKKPRSTKPQPATTNATTPLVQLQVVAVTSPPPLVEPVQLPLSQEQQQQLDFLPAAMIPRIPLDPSIYPSANKPPNYYGDPNASREPQPASCGKVPWYGWLMIGGASGLLIAGCVFVFLFRLWKASFMRSYNHLMQRNSTTSYMHEFSIDKSSSNDEKITTAPRAQMGSLYAIEPVIVTNKPPLARAPSKDNIQIRSGRCPPRSLGLSSTHCWSSAPSDLIEAEIAAPSPVPSITKRRAPVPPSASSSAPSSAGSNPGAKKKKKRRVLKKTLAVESDGEGENPANDELQSPPLNKAASNSMLSLPPINSAVLPPSQSRHSIKSIHKVYVADEATVSESQRVQLGRTNRSEDADPLALSVRTQAGEGETRTAPVWLFTKEANDIGKSSETPAKTSAPVFVRTEALEQCVNESDRAIGRRLCWLDDAWTAAQRQRRREQEAVVQNHDSVQQQL